MSASHLYNKYLIWHPLTEVSYFIFLCFCRNGQVSWDEFISHLILGFHIREVSTEVQSLEAPIAKLPIMMRSNHRHPVCRITFSPTIRADRTFTYSDGNYVTCSKDGVINYWTLDMQHDRTVQSTCPELKVRALSF